MVMDDMWGTLNPKPLNPKVGKSLHLWAAPSMCVLQCSVDPRSKLLVSPYHTPLGNPPLRSLAYSFVMCSQYCLIIGSLLVYALGTVLNYQTDPYLHPKCSLGSPNVSSSPYVGSKVGTHLYKVCQKSAPRSCSLGRLRSKSLGYLERLPQFAQTLDHGSV